MNETKNESKKVSADQNVRIETFDKRQGWQALESFDSLQSAEDRKAEIEATESGYIGKLRLTKKASAPETRTHDRSLDNLSDHTPEEIATILHNDAVTRTGRNHTDQIVRTARKWAAQFNMEMLNICDATSPTVTALEHTIESAIREELAAAADPKAEAAQ